MENTWAVEMWQPMRDWVIVAADMTEPEANKYIADHRVNGAKYRTRKLGGPAYSG